MFYIKKKNYLLISILFAIITAVLTFLFIQSSTNTIKAFSLGDIKKDSSTVFVVKDYEGKVAIFLKNEAKPFVVLDTMTTVLPQEDIASLEKGIEVQGSDALRELIEDLTS
ncbi:MAG: hypothetical protein GX346_03110 [Clostridiales bacterium]|nr:hypothetical protein [Clostridiales bacterium]